ncbi:phosphatase PAP2 family protein [Salinicoccus sp. ID82-1]|uniref:phosphatase PAP2 family protein n=1 Tax=Salinicoccus sp. ID82-1 TaxID=2820269 RepID=UPI001F35346A|nr:phosphatase PAP2 family protein [Salinicoccus sp. ID82-1]MCG1009628.1 phosphatase PAP2 family protein [Salinicoccus sp. ID82-1]
MEQKNKNTSFPILVLLIGLSTAIFFLWLFAELSDELLEKELQSFDNAIVSFFDSIATPPLDTIYIIITELGAVWFLGALSAITILYLWVKPRDKWGIVFFIITMGGGALLTTLLKQFYGRNRPSINEAIDATGFSFPSGHSLGALIFYGFVAYIIIRRTRKRLVVILALIVASILILLIGTSRIYLGAHFPSDVLAGYSAGTVWLLLCLLALEWVQWRSHSDVRSVDALRDILKNFYRKGKRKMK